MPPELLALKIAAAFLGVFVVSRAIASAVRVFVLPRASNEPIARLVFTQMRHLFEIAIRGRPYASRDHVLAYFAPEPGPETHCSVSREGFDIACDELIHAGIPVKADRDAAWRDFRGWRINYDQTLLALAALTAAPPARWNGRPWEVIEPVNPARTRPFEPRPPQG